MQTVVDFGRAFLSQAFTVGSNNSVPGLFIALCIALAFMFARLKRPRPIAIAVLRRAILPKRVFASASSRTDILFALSSIILFSSFVGWFVISEAVIRSSVGLAVSEQLGPPSPSQWPAPAIAVVTTFALYLGYEFGYWLDHYLSHRFEVLWRFHAVHHSAESLSPLTNFRVHPVDTIVFGNILALVSGVIGGFLEYEFGTYRAGLKIGGTNALMLVGFMLLTTLQHSHFWISFSGPWGKIFLSPAHHQVHHSTDPAHFNKNLGSTLAIWDLLFGTLYVPQRRREKLTFGVIGIEKPHSLRAAIFQPFVEASDHLTKNLGRSRESPAEDWSKAATE